MSYKLADVIWNDDGTMTSKEITPLEALEKLKENIRNEKHKYKLANIVSLTIIEPSLKVLQIILEKKVNFGYLVQLVDLFGYDEALEQYNRSCFGTIEELTQEEYDLLKEVSL